MKYLYFFILVVFLFSATGLSQNYTFRYNPYSGMNQDQLELALEQARKLERNGKIWTTLGAGMMVSGTIMTFKGINMNTNEGSFNYTSFGTGMVIMCFSAIPLGYGIFAWMSGNERANMIEIELLAFDSGKSS